MYKCTNCNCRFEEPKSIRTSYESYYGVSDLFDSYNYMDLLVCPECDYEDIEKLKQCGLCEEWFEEDELEISDEIKVGCNNYRCKDCYEEEETKYKLPFDDEVQKGLESLSIRKENE